MLYDSNIPRKKQVFFVYGMFLFLLLSYELALFNKHTVRSVNTFDQTVENLAFTFGMFRYYL